MDSRELVQNARELVDRHRSMIRAVIRVTPESNAVADLLEDEQDYVLSLCEALEASERARERLRSQLNATTRALAKGRYLDAEIIEVWPDVTLAEVMAEIHENRTPDVLGELERRVKSGIDGLTTRGSALVCSQMERGQVYAFKTVLAMINELREVGE